MSATEKFEFSDFSDKTNIINQILGFCHNLIKVDNEILGDTIELEMLEKSPFQLNSPEFTILKTFEFESSLQRMSVIVKNEKTSELFVLCKGSPEVLKDICQKSSINSELALIQQKYFMQGYRILAMASKPINSTNI